MTHRTGAAVLCSTLERLGARHVFGIPGSQNVSLFEALRCSSLRTVLSGSELSAAMMANGYYRASGKVGVLATIPGPGLAFAIPGIAEASQDSAAVLCITGKPASTGGARFARQAIDQYSILKPLTRSIIEIDAIDDIEAAVTEAYVATTRDEPGPVLLHVDERAMTERTNHSPDPLPPQTRRAPERASILEAVHLLSLAKRIVIYVGQGAADAYKDLGRLAVNLNAPVVATRSARGILPDDHPLSLVFDDTPGSVQALNSLLRMADLVLAVGCKFTHNGSFGFRLQLEPAKLIHVDASRLSLNANYPARLAICADAAVFLTALLAELGLGKSVDRGWCPEHLDELRKQGTGDVPEPVLRSMSPSTPRAFFSALRAAMPDNSFLVTDSGQHQVLATRHFRVRVPRGLIIPSDFQSMGFGLPAAIGAKLAAPERTAVVLMGDGGLLMCGMEVAAAVREKVPLVVVVLKDQSLGLIRSQQESAYGHSFATDLFVPDLKLFAQSMGARYCLLDSPVEPILRQLLTDDGVTIVEVSVETSASMRVQQAKGVVKSVARNNPHLRWLAQKLGLSPGLVPASSKALKGKVIE